ncbi:MAG: endo-1,4-beta-xylanase [bacterium]|nr:endo-1,4-beta-xylanase [bacterium]
MRRSATRLFLIALLLSAAPSRGQLMSGGEKFHGCIVQSGPSIPRSWPSYWNQVTPENAGKWGSVEYTRDSYNWAELDKAYNYARTNGFPFRFHCLVWGKQQPGWIADLDSAQQAEEVEEWIRTAGERYPEADYVEVVNEAIEFQPYDYYPVYRNALGGAGATGWDWVIRAFEIAREAFPDSKLLLNEYNLFGGAKSITTYLKIVNLLKERGLIDGVCEQGHFLESVGAATIKSRLDQLASTGLPVQITEFDLNIADDTAQLNKYKAIFPALWEHPSVEGVTFWGYIEGTMWRADGWLVSSRGVERPAMVWLKEYFANWTSAVSGPAGAAGPEGFGLLPNFPNPFNPSTSIRFTLPAAGRADVSILDVSGRAVRTLVSGWRPAGPHTVRWNGLDDAGAAVPAGVYFCRMNAGPFSATRKLTLVK